jgi:hypothetical protein
MYMLGSSVRLVPNAPVHENFAGREGYVTAIEGDMATVHLFGGGSVLVMREFVQEISVGELQFKVQDRGCYGTDYLIGYRIDDVWCKRWIVAEASSLEMGQLIYAVLKNATPMINLLLKLTTAGTPPTMLLSQIGECINQADTILNTITKDMKNKGIQA